MCLSLEQIKAKKEAFQNDLKKIEQDLMKLMDAKSQHIGAIQAMTILEMEVQKEEVVETVEGEKV